MNKSHDHSHESEQGSSHDHAPHQHHHGSAHATAGLTRNQTLVLQSLNQTKAPLSAYAILDALRAEGLRAPLQVYRALEKLVELGFVHRLESLNAFVACQHVGCGGVESVAFAICGACGKVEEVQDLQLSNELKLVSQKTGFVLANSVVELRGTCAVCQFGNP
jgi:Fur family transcriptional regulator, zinc uptake regulator